MTNGRENQPISHSGDGRRPRRHAQQRSRLGGLDAFLGFRLRRLQNRLSKDFAEATAGHELRSGMISSLAIISANPGISQNELAGLIGADKSMVVQIVDDLERRGRAVRTRSSTDRRRYALQTTEEGERYLTEILGILRTVESVVSERLTRAEEAMLHELLDRVYAHWSVDE